MYRGEYKKINLVVEIERWEGLKKICEHSIIERFTDIIKIQSRIALKKFFEIFC